MQTEIITNNSDSTNEVLKQNLIKLREKGMNVIQVSEFKMLIEQIVNSNNPQFWMTVMPLKDISLLLLFSLAM